MQNTDPMDIDWQYLDPDRMEIDVQNTDPIAIDQQYLDSDRMEIDVQPAMLDAGGDTIMGNTELF